MAAAAVAATALLAGCHHNNNQTSGYGVGWVTVGSVPAPEYAAYIVTVTSVTLTDSVGNVYTALATAEPVDFTKLRDISELWGSATIPNATYASATIVVDYSLADIEVMVGGVPTKATVTDSTGAALTTLAVTVKLDPATPFTINPSYSTDNAQRLAVSLDLPASTRIDLTTSPPKAHVSPFVTVALAPADSKLIRIRGPLVNTSTALGTYSIYERPFYDQANSIGTLSIFNDANTLFTIDGKYYTGFTAGVGQLTQSSAGVTMTASYGTFTPTKTTTGYAGKFNSVYVIAGTSLQSEFTENLTGDVIARSGNTLTVRGCTIYGQLISESEGYFGFQAHDCLVTVGPGTVVTADDDAGAAAAALGYQSIGVGAHIVALGTYSLSAAGVAAIDASLANAGQVRLQSNRLAGTLVSASPGSLVLDLATINGWPASVYNFAGNGATAGGNPTAATFAVNTGTLDESALAATTPLWLDGFVNAFGAAPPAFTASAATQEAAVPATLRALWATTGTTTPFTAIASTGFSLNLTNTALSSAVIQVGAETITLSTLPASPQVVPTTTPVSIVTYPTFSPIYAIGGVATTAAPTAAISVFSAFPTFVTSLNTAITTTTPVVELDAVGYYNRAANTFTANSISVVL